MAINTITRVSGTGKLKLLDEDQVLTAQSAVNDGAWMEGWFYTYISYDVRTLAAGDVVQIRGSNELTQPPNAVHGLQVGTDITAAEIRTVSTPPRWIKIRKSTAAGSPGATDAYLAAIWEV